MDFDTTVKMALYGIIAEAARVPDAAGVARGIGVPVDDVIAAFGRLHQKRLLVPEPGDPSRVRMAPPFSGVETPFLVRANGKGYYANCVWDVLGVAAALHTDAVVEASDGHTGEALRMEVRDGALSSMEVRHGASVPVESRAGGPVPVHARGGVPAPADARRGTIAPMDDHGGSPVPTQICDGATVPIYGHDGAPAAMGAVAHFAVPAARWWADIVFT